MATHRRVSFREPGWPLPSTQARVDAGAGGAAGVPAQMAFEHRKADRAQLAVAVAGDAVGPQPHEGDIARHAAEARATRRQA